MKQASMIGLRDSLIQTLCMLTFAPGNTAHRPGSSSATGGTDIAHGYAQAIHTPEDQGTIHGQGSDHAFTSDSQS